jgi:hypothetical protein
MRRGARQEQFHIQHQKSTSNIEYKKPSTEFTVPASARSRSNRRRVPPFAAKQYLAGGALAAPITYS